METFNPHALLIGVGAYGDPAWQAPVALADTQAFYEALVDPRGAAFPPGQVSLLRDEQATPAGMAEGFRRLAERTAAEDTVLVIFTGHGAMGDDEIYYLGAYGTQFTADGRIAGETGFSVADLFRGLREIRARRLLLIVNACFAGHLGSTLAADLATGSVLPDQLAAELARINEGRAILTASRADQFSYYPRNGQASYFGAALVEGLRGVGARPATGFIGLFELYAYLYRQTRQAVERFGLRQEPVLTLLQGVGPFPLARYPGAQPGEPAEPIRQRPPADVAVRIIERDQVNASGQGAVAVKAEQGSKVTISTSSDKHVGVDLGGANISGVVTIGNASGGDLVINNPGPTTGPDLGPAIGQLKDRLEQLADLDPDIRDDGALKLDQARRALAAGDRERAARRLRETAGLLHGTGRPAVDALAAQLEALGRMLA